MQGFMSLGFEGGIMRGLKQRQKSLWSENLITVLKVVIDH